MQCLGRLTGVLFLFLSAFLYTHDARVLKTKYSNERNIIFSSIERRVEDCSCENGVCVNEGGKNICKCNPGYGNYSDTRCKACECGADTNCMWTKEFWTKKICFCKPGYEQKGSKCVVDPCLSIPCKNGGECTVNIDGFKCKCPGIWSGTTCEEYCNCGEYSKSCRYSLKGEKICECFHGFAENNGSCDECNCGPYGSCDFKYGQKICYCQPFAIEKNGVCIIMESTTLEITTAEKTTILTSTTQQCNCGPYGSCDFKYGQKICYCQPFAIEKNGVCIVMESTTAEKTTILPSTTQQCDCGPRGRCTFESGQKKCTCDPFTSERDGRCVECNCGVKAQSCFYRKNGIKVCNCDFGYTQINGYCSAICSEEKCVHGKCEVVGNEFKCRCNKGFTGQRCEDEIETKSNKPDLWKIILVAIVFAIFLLNSAMLCSLGRIRNKMSKK